MDVRERENGSYLRNDRTRISDSSMIQVSITQLYHHVRRGMGGKGGYPGPALHGHSRLRIYDCYHRSSFLFPCRRKQRDRTYVLYSTYPMRNLTSPGRRVPRTSRAPSHLAGLGELFLPRRREIIYACHGKPPCRSLAIASQPSRRVALGALHEAGGPGAGLPRVRSRRQGLAARDHSTVSRVRTAHEQTPTK